MKKDIHFKYTIMSNFDYLKDIDFLSDLHQFCTTAENAQKNAPDYCAINCRKAMEWLVKAIYTLKGIEISSKDSLYELLAGAPFVEFIDDRNMMFYANYIRKIGNKGAHTGGVTDKESFLTLLNTYNLIGTCLIKLKAIKTLAPFNKELIPHKGAIAVSTNNIEVAPSAQLANHIDSNNAINPPTVELNLDYSEAETRKCFINLMLEEAGWEVLTKDGAIIPSKAGIEIEVAGMPNNKGAGYADYVLFGANGKPLAVVEAKRTTKDPKAGRQQAILYAECLEKQYGIKPIVYYTNGFKTYIIDGLGYPDREVLGFHTEDDLQILLQRRNRDNIKDLHINDNITDREYQKRGIRAICEHFNSNHRRGLLVMATGTGKTRVSISLCDVLMRNGWVKNILFLADRTALVNQAAKNFTKLLPSATTAVLSDNKAPDKNARIMFSTYQTMINYIDTETKEFSIGRFDLIIIDEAHRSVFGKYTAIFDYFDSLLVGLTATPRNEVERSTYDLFELESGEPNFAYELEEAVEDGYLINYTPLTRSSSIMTKGIRYDELTDDEKKQMEAIWKYEQARNTIEPDKTYHRDISNKEIFKYIFNKDTIDKVLEDLMKNGLKIHGGDIVGKSIIFAYNHKHADLIVERFNKLYPELGSDFCVLIDNTVNYSQTLINSFELRDKMPQIAVSVDMLDTGIDVPDILNLVFFKPVHSYIKFWQMIGRGTRLSKDVFDAGKDKETFYIFDWCGNFEYFSINPKGQEATAQVSLTERLFGMRVDLACALQNTVYQNDTYAKHLHDEIKEILYNQVQKLNETHISVRKEIELVDKFKQKDSWTAISTLDVLDLKERIAKLLVGDLANDAAKKFDILLLNIQLSMVDSTVHAEKSKFQVENIAEMLQDKASIPQVQAKMSILKEVCTQVFWENANLERLEYVRTEMRELVQFLIGMGNNRTFTIDIEDSVEEGETAYVVNPHTTYKQRIIDFLANNKDMPVIRKVQDVEQLTAEDIKELETILWSELGTKEEYKSYIQSRNLICGDSVGAFIRTMVGIDRNIAMQKFSQFLSDNVLNSAQEEYLKTIIAYVSKNGDISKADLVNTAPFDGYDWISVFGQSFKGVVDGVENLHNTIIA